MLVCITGERNKEVLTTTSRKIAEVFEKNHKEVLRDIESLSFSNEFRERNFALSSYTSEQNKALKEYIVTKDGFVMLAMGYTGSKAMKFKEDYINAFNAMESELKRIYEERKQWEIERAKGVVIRHILTDTIKMKVSDSPHKKFMYPNYTKLIYKALFGVSYNQLQEKYGVKPKENLREYFTTDELKDVESMEMLVSSLINCGWGYEQIKTFVQQNAIKQIA
ncbi:MAG: Rha family transcriptional regulator [Oscillospiraceae bacterium]|nr:Rha family transcriptional regulator [Oscillospiraceae bacterium]